MRTNYKNPERKAKLLKKRARQAEDGVLAMAEYQRKEAEIRERTRRLREARLARDSTPQDAPTKHVQTSVIPECIYCRTKMSRVLKDTLLSSHAYSIFKCYDCGWEIAVPLVDVAQSPTLVPDA